jgi:23S rRNA (cytosine1962-C5)-methyltransferase
MRANAEGAKAPKALPRVDLKTEKRNFHPWVYRKMLERPAEGGARDGDAVEIYDRRGAFIGRGFYNGRSQIALRVLDWGGRGAPLDFAFFRDRVERAVAIRREVLDLEQRTNAYRAVNSEGDGLSGVVVDIYGAHAVCEIMSLGAWRARQWVEQALRGLYALEGVHFRADERIQQLEGFRAKHDEAATPVEINENGVRFEVNVTGGHKTGFFLDQRDNRREVAELAAGKRVLDLCCYTGGFSLYARVLGHAKEAVGVDLDERAIAQAERNARLNGLAGPDARLRFLHANAFHFLKEERDPRDRWDLVVLDPSKLAPTREGLDAALRDYYDLNRLALRNLKPGGLFLTCSCSGLVSLETFLGVVANAGADAGREVRVLKTSGPGADHPIVADFPEGLYLKVVLAQALERC